MKKNHSISFPSPCAFPVLAVLVEASLRVVPLKGGHGSALRTCQEHHRTGVRGVKTPHIGSEADAPCREVRHLARSRRRCSEHACSAISATNGSKGSRLFCKPVMASRLSG